MDSFAAHAGPLFDCLTLVLANPICRTGRFRSNASFYFDPAWPIDHVTGAMGGLLHEIRHPKTVLELDASFSKAELDLPAAPARWSSRFGTGRRIRSSRISTAGSPSTIRLSPNRRRAAPLTSGLFADSFATVIRGPEAGWTAASAPGMTPHLRDQIERWQNTNFAKYVRHATTARSRARRRRRPHGRGRRNWTEQGAPSQLATVLIGGIKAILREQLPTGEMPTYFRIGGGALEYRRTPLLSSFVHDALGTSTCGRAGSTRIFSTRSRRGARGGSSALRR